MPGNQTTDSYFGLERLCTIGASAQNRIRAAPSLHGVERVEAFFKGRPYAPHRHDTYGIGITTHGVQSFEYRGATQHSLAGQVYVLHPDEMHDGRAGTEAGFSYRTLYVEPGLVRRALDGRALPFVRTPVSDDRRLCSAVEAFLGQMTQSIDEFSGTDLTLELAEALERISEGPQVPVRIDGAAVAAARDLLVARACHTVSSSELEAATGHDRWSLARQFRAAYGVSPHRFQTLRRIDRARVLIGEGVSLAEAAQQTGFADQSHLSRHFRSALGVPPGVWRSLTRGDGD